MVLCRKEIKKHDVLGSSFPLRMPVICTKEERIVVPSRGHLRRSRSCKRGTGSCSRRGTSRSRSWGGAEGGSRAGGGACGRRGSDKLCAQNTTVGQGLANGVLHVASSTGERDVNTAAGGRASCDTASQVVDVGHGQVTTVVIDATLNEVGKLSVRVNEVGSVVARAGGRGHGGSGGG